MSPILHYECNMIKLIKQYIWVTFEQEGIHCYPAALTDPALKDVLFLGHPHRHIFKFNVKIEVFHDDRDIEFILFKRELQGLFTTNVINIDYKSCEMLALDIGSYVLSKYPGRQLVVSVSEDGENGAEIHFS